MEQNFFTTRRTVRRYTDRRVDDSLLTRLLEEASHAPTTGNMQLYSVIVTRDADAKKRLAPAHFNQPSVEGCDVLLTFCADYNRFIRWCEVSDAVPGYGNFQSFVTAVIDTVIFAQQFCTLAEMEGLGCCYLGTTTYNAPMIAGALGLPAMVVPVVTLSVGWPAENPPVSDRLAPEAFIHAETYRPYTDSRIREIYAPKEALPDSRRFVEENEKKTLAQVFTDVRYTKAAAEEFSRVYLDHIRRQGYDIG